MKKRNILVLLLIAVLTVLMVVSVIPVGAVAAFAESVSSTADDGAAEEPAEGPGVETGNPALDDSIPVGDPGPSYTPVGTGITTAEEFNNMDPAGSYYLAGDITVDTTFAGFCGVFDGNGHTVTVSVPLFDAPQTATIKNLTVEGSVTVVNNASTAAVASGTAFGCNFFNILNKATVAIAEGDTGTYSRASGIVGRTGGYTILERCTNEGNMTGYAISAGISALLSADAGSEAVVLNCVNKGTITVVGPMSAGGIFCGVECPSVCTLIWGCRNEGAVTANAGVGGILAYTTNKSENSVRIVNCTNAGVITSTDNHAGGIIASAGTPITLENCVNETTGKVIAGSTSTSSQRRGAGIIAASGDVAVLIENCMNYAEVEGSGQSGGIGGWLLSANVTLRGCINYGNVTSRLNYCAGIIGRADRSAYETDLEILIEDCVNRGNVTSYTGQVAGIYGYSQANATFIRCVNYGTVGARTDTPATASVNAGGIAATVMGNSSFEDCRNEGDMTSHPATSNGTAFTGGNAGGILAYYGNASAMGTLQMLRCVNTGDLTVGVVSGSSTATSGNCYAGGLIGYQYCSSSYARPEIRFCMSTGDITSGTQASYAIGYMNGNAALFADNVFAGTLSSVIYPSGKTANNSNVFNILAWNNANTLPAGHYVRNYVASDFSGAVLNNMANTGAGTPVSFEGYAYTYDKETKTAEEIYAEVLAAAEEEISTPEQFAAMKADGRYKLTADITLTATYTTAFSGVLNGNGHTLTISAPVFALLNSAAQVKDLTLAGTITGATGITGALAQVGGGYFTNVINRVNITASGGRTGGFIGSNEGVNFACFTDCVNAGNIEVSDAFSTGGFVGYVNRASHFVNCTNTGNVKSAGHTGGIVGESQILGTTYTSCVNTGSITSTATTGSVGAAGIQGYNGNNVVYITDCYNSGTVSGRLAAGICGDSAKSFVITGCVNAGRITSTGAGAGGIYNHHNDSACAANLICTTSVNTGEIGGTGALGGIAGYSGQLANNYGHLITFCINVGNITGVGRNRNGTINDVASLVGYAYAGPAISLTVNSCIAGGTVTATTGDCVAMVGYANTALVTMQNNIICAELKPATGKNAILYYGTNSAEISSSISNNTYKEGCAGYDAFTGYGATTVGIGEKSTNNIVVPAFAIPAGKVTKQMLFTVGISETNGAYTGAYAYLFAEGANAENQVGIYNAEGELVAKVASLTEAERYIEDGSTVRLLADYYSSTAVRIAPRGVAWTLDGNSYAMYFAANGSTYQLRLTGNGSTLTVENLKVYAHGYGVQVGESYAMEMEATFRNAVIYAGSRYETGYYTYNAGTALSILGNYTNVKLLGEDTTAANSSEALLYVSGGLYVENGSFESRISSVVYVPNSAGGMPIVLKNGSYTSPYHIINIVNVTTERTIEIFDGEYTPTSNGNCVIFGTGNSRANVIVRIYGGQFENASNGNLFAGFCAVSGGTPVEGSNGTLEIYGGTFTKSNISRLVKYYGNQNFYFYGGTFTSTSDDIVAYALPSGITYATESHIVFGTPEDFTAPEGVTVQPLVIDCVQSLFYCDSLAAQGVITVDIYSGSYSLGANDAGISARGSSVVTVHGGEITLEPKNETQLGQGGLIQVRENVNLTVKGGTLTQAAPAIENNWKCNLILLESGYTGDILVSGGTLTGKSCGFYLNAPMSAGSVTVTGGQITTDNQTLYLQGTANTTLRLAGGTLTSVNNNVVHVCANGEIARPDTFDEDTAFGFVIEGDTVLDAQKGSCVYMGCNRMYVLTVNGGTLTASVAAFDLWMCGELIINDVTATTEGVAIGLQNMNYVEINGGEFTVTTKNYVLRTYSTTQTDANTGDYTRRYYAPRKVVINNGSFVTEGAPDACLSFEGVYDSNTEVIINGGYFENQGGMCVARVLAGRTQNEMGADNTILVETGTSMTIKGGIFVLAAGGRTENYCAVIRCGGGTTYGTVVIRGGTFINQNTGSTQVVLKNNTCASLAVQGGRFLANSSQIYFLKTNGNANVTTDGGYTPSCSHQNVEIDEIYSQHMTYADADYYLWLVLPAVDEEVKMTMTEGAQVRMNVGSTGIRFVSTISADKVAAAKLVAGEDGTVSFGTLIAPIDYVMKAGAFTIEALEACTELDGLRARYVNIAAVEGLYEDSAGNVEIRAALTNIQEKNYDRGFAAVSYVKVETADGDVTYFYGTFDTAANVRTIHQIAVAALADVSDTAFGLYVFLTEDGKYSRYNETQRAVLKVFAGEANT